MKVAISVLLPAIRKDNWVKLYNSLKESTSRNFELIIIGPYSLPPELQNIKCIKYIKDYGNPVRASQIGAMVAEGKYITWAADDGVFLEGALERAIDYLESKPDKHMKDVVINNYFEAGKVLPEHVLKLKVAYPHGNFIPDDWYIFNVATMHTDFFYELGGYDCRYEACPFAHSDLAVRAQRSGAEVHVHNEAMLRCGHMPGTTGDHAPIHFAQLTHDQQLYTDTYDNPRSVDRINIDLENWKDAPSIWERRFGRKNK